MDVGGRICKCWTDQGLLFLLVSSFWLWLCESGVLSNSKIYQKKQFVQKIICAFSKKCNFCFDANKTWTIYVWKHIFRTSTVKIFINFTLLKPAGLLFHITTALLHTCSASTCAYVQKYKHVIHSWAHTHPLPLCLLLHVKLKLKKPFAFKYFYSIRSFTTVLCFVVGVFFHDQGHEGVQMSHWWIGWSSLNVELDLAAPSFFLSPGCLSRVFGSGPTLRP